MRSELNKVKITEHEQDVLSIIGKYNHETPIKQRTNPAIIKLLQFYKMDAAKVYNDYSLLKKYGWLEKNTYSNLDGFKSAVRRVKSYINTDIKRPDTVDTNTNEVIIDNINEENLSEKIYFNKIINNQKKEIETLKINEYKGKKLVESLSECIRNVKPDKFIINSTKSIKPIKSNRYSILPISDAHFGEVVNSLSINGLNSYNTDISKRRHIKLFDENYKYSCEFGCSELNLFFLGDIFSGNIHDELRETNEYPITYCVIDYFKFIVGLIDAYVEKYEKINIACVAGNHSRITQKFQFKNKAYDNYEYILYSMIEFYYKDSKKVSVKVSDAPVLCTNVGKQVWKLEHGDLYKGGGAFISPMSTVLRDNFKDMSMYKSMGQNFDAVIMGHWHIGCENIMQGSNTPVYLNPSIVGPSEYAVHNMHSNFPASSYMFVTDGNNVISKGFITLMDIV
jgi:hypothetical protein